MGEGLPCGVSFNPPQGKGEGEEPRNFINYFFALANILTLDR
jgi:hypothetical protein